MDRRRFLKTAAGLFIPAAPALFLPKAASAQMPMTGAGLAKPASGAFTPASLPNVYAWFDASDSSTVFKDAGVTPAANGDVVAQWNDKIGNGNLSAGATKPTLNTTGFNSARGVAWNATQSIFSNTRAALNTSTISMFCLMVTPGGSDSFGCIVGLWDQPNNADPGDDNHSFDYVINAGAATNIMNRNSVGNDGAATYALNTPQSFGCILSGGTFQSYISFATTVSFSMPNNLCPNSSQIMLGNDNFNKVFGTIAEVVFTTGAMSNTDRNNLKAYWLAKWGVF